MTATRVHLVSLWGPALICVGSWLSGFDFNSRGSTALTIFVLCVAVYAFLVIAMAPTPPGAPDDTPKDVHIGDYIL